MAIEYKFENNVNIFSSRDKIRDQIIDIAKKQLVLENFDFNQTSYLSYLINTLSVLSSNNIFYNSNIWKQFFLITASQRESVMNLSTMLGYVPRLAYPSYATVLVTIPLKFMKNLNNVSANLNGIILDNTIDYNINPHKFYADDIIFCPVNTHNIYIEKNLEINAETNNFYRAVIKEIYQGKDDIINNGSRSENILPYVIKLIDNNEYVLQFNVKCVQLFKLEDNSEFTIPSLNKFEIFYKDIKFSVGQLSDVNIFTINSPTLKREIEPKITKSIIKEKELNNQKIDFWKKYSALPLIPNNENGYVIKEIKNGVRIYFGNGIYGNQPLSGDNCKIDLFLTNGNDGNVLPGAINKSDPLKVTITDVQISANRRIKNNNVNIFVINPEPAYGGMDTPTIDEIRRGAITHVKTNSRLVTRDDYANFSSIVRDLPVLNTTQVLKRSDLKRNEICLFTDLIYNDLVNNNAYVVPTRNCIWELETESLDMLYIRTDDLNYVKNIDGEDYYPIFNMKFNPSTKECTYYYSASEVEVPVNITRTETSNPKVTMYSCKFFTDYEELPQNDKIQIHLNYIDVNVIQDDTLDLYCKVTIPWNGKEYDMPMDSSNSRFTLTNEDLYGYLNVVNIPDGVHTFKFEILDNNDNGRKLVTCFSTVILVKTLDDYMKSDVIQVDSSTYKIYDVPLILKNYYDKIDKGKFNYFILLKYINFDVTRYRMLTDFISLKLSNTTGKSKNMLLNDLTREEMDYLNPQEVDIDDVYEFGSDGLRIAISSDHNRWNRQGGFVAIKSAINPGRFVFEEIQVNDMFIYNNKKYIYNGEQFLEPIFDIPLQIKLVVWIDTNYSGNDSSLITKIKTELINNFYKNFGYNKQVLVSEINRIVKSIKGVANCKVLSPEFDIIFNYDLDYLTEEQLIEYTPELMYFDVNSISIDLRV